MIYRNKDIRHLKKDPATGRICMVIWMPRVETSLTLIYDKPYRKPFQHFTKTYKQGYGGLGYFLERGLCYELKSSGIWFDEHPDMDPAELPEAFWVKLEDKLLEMVMTL